MIDTTHLPVPWPGDPSYVPTTINGTPWGNDEAEIFNTARIEKPVVECCENCLWWQLHFASSYYLDRRPCRLAKWGWQEPLYSRSSATVSTDGCELMTKASHFCNQWTATEEQK